MDSSISAQIDSSRVEIVIPDDFELPADGVHARWPDPPLEQERRLNKFKIYAARHFAYANRLNRVVLDSDKPRLGIITTGKAYLDVMQALEDLGIDEREAARIGLRVFKLGMSWPLEPIATHEFARGLEEILVVEEKRSIVEDQLTGQLYNWPVAERPRVFGEFDEHGNDLLPNLGELTPARVARAIASRIDRFHTSKTIRARLRFLEAKEERLAEPRGVLARLPHYCSGCPHNTSTKLPAGSRGGAGIGCHYMVTWMDRETHTFTQMGGEGATWIGQAPFTETSHVFQNLGDGTYFHSGLLAIRAAISSGVNITYKILYNDAVAMTGGQPVDGTISVAQIVHQLRGEGVKRIAVVSDEPDKYPADFPAFTGLTVDHRQELERIQLELREIPGTTILIYDQTCAAEKRRRRKRGLLEDPARRIFINEDVCEGCGDCSQQSNCLSILPMETELGRKRAIDQSACNKDYSCVDGFCPSFVSVIGGRLKKPNTPKDVTRIVLPEPDIVPLGRPWNVLVTGVGGTGVLTVSSVLAMAAHLEGKGCATMNQTGLAQKFGAVVSHVRIGNRQRDIQAVRIAAGDADLLLGCDLVVAASFDSLAKLDCERSHAIVNTYQSPTAAFVSNPDLVFPSADMQRKIAEETGLDKTWFVDSTRIATAVMGDAIGSNFFLLGFAYQKGLLPVSAQAIEAAIELNDVAVDFNRKSFILGREAAHDLESINQIAKPQEGAGKPLARSLDEIIDFRAGYLVNYQDQAYADLYRDFVDEVRRIEHQQIIDTPVPEPTLTEAVARNLFKLMAYKDEYEVARLYSDGVFRKKLAEQFEGDYTLQFHLAPPLLAKIDPVSGRPRKRTFPGWTLKLFTGLAQLKFLRGSPLDVFGYSTERKRERALIADYKSTIEELLPRLSTGNHELAVRIASLPDKIRGFGPVKAKSITSTRAENARLMVQWRSHKTLPDPVVKDVA